MSTPHAYDTVPYPSHAYTETHPLLIEGLARLAGLNPAPAERARVLELGCASGGNLLPIADSLPESRCVGVDFSARQVEQALSLVREAGLKNVELICQSIVDFPRDSGPFDYIIAHGVFSWAPAPVQEAILDVCRCCLAPGGVAYISYNVLPGWHLKSWMRQAMLLRSRGGTDPEQGVRQAIEFLDFLANNEPYAQHPVSAAIRLELAAIKRRPANYLLHDYMEEENEPILFQEFIARLTRHELVYLADAMTNRWQVPDHPYLQRLLAEIGNDRILREQYMDFLFNRDFRRSLVVKAGQPWDTSPAETRLERMYLMSQWRPVAAAGGAEMAFIHPKKGQFATADRGMMAALLHLAKQTPRAVAVGELLEVVQRAVGASGPQEGAARAIVLRQLLEYIMHGLIHAYSTPPRFAAAPPDRPRVSALARCLSRRGEMVTSLLHEPIALQPRQTMFLGLCDGTRTAADLAAAVPGVDETTVREMLAELARNAMLQP